MAASHKPSSESEAKSRPRRSRGEGSIDETKEGGVRGLPKPSEDARLEARLHLLSPLDVDVDILARHSGCVHHPAGR